MLAKKKKKKKKKISDDIHLFPKHNQPPCTETHLSLRVGSLPSPDQDSHLSKLFMFCILITLSEIKLLFKSRFFDVKKAQKDQFRA